MKEISIIGVDLVKNVFQLHGAAADGSRRLRHNRTECRRADTYPVTGRIQHPGAVDSVAGVLSNTFGLRLVASISLLISAGSLAYLGSADFHDPGFDVPAALAVAGLTLSIGLTASSIAIMGSVEPEKGGAAGSLEGTGCELRTGLGITLFGVFMATVFSRSIALPQDLALPLAQQASRSIGDVYLVANQLPSEQGAALIAAGKAAFSAAHVTLLSSAAAVMAALAIAVYFLVASYRPIGNSTH